MGFVTSLYATEVTCLSCYFHLSASPITLRRRDTPFFSLIPFHNAKLKIGPKLKKENCQFLSPFIDQQMKQLPKIYFGCILIATNANVSYFAVMCRLHLWFLSIRQISIGCRWLWFWCENALTHRIQLIVLPIRH